MNAMQQIRDGLRGQTLTACVAMPPTWSRSLILHPNLLVQTSERGHHPTYPALELRWDEVEE